MALRLRLAGTDRDIPAQESGLADCNFLTGGLRVALFCGAPGMARSALTGAVPVTVVVIG